MDRKALIESAPDYTADLLTRHYSRDFQGFLDGLDENVMWIGPLKHQFVIGKNKVKEILSAEQQVVFRFVNSYFKLAAADENSCVVIGWLEVCTEEESGYVLKCRQRVTFTYAVKQETLRVTHMHVSESWDVLDENEIFPFRLATQTYDYLQQLLKNKTGGYKKLTLYDTRKRAHFIMENEIIYIESCNIHSYVYYINGRILATDSIAALQAELSDRFVRVHRSYIVNIDYVIGMERFAVQLCDGVRVPVPEKKYVRLRQEIIRRLPEKSTSVTKTHAIRKNPAAPRPV